MPEGDMVLWIKNERENERKSVKQDRSKACIASRQQRKNTKQKQKFYFRNCVNCKQCCIFFFMYLECLCSPNMDGVF